MYQIIQPPFTLKFPEMSKKELKDYNEWFFQVLPERLKILTSAIKSTAGYEKWEPDFAVESLDTLGEWFLQQVETRRRTQEEIENLKNKTPFRFDVPDEELTNKTFSLAIDIGMYFSQVFLKHYPSLKWVQPLGNKRFVDYGQPVLEGFGKLSFNPVDMMVTHAYGLKSGNRNGAGLRRIYEYWAALARGEKPPVRAIIPVKQK